MHIRYENILIRNATPDDAALLANWWNDGKVMAHAGFPNGEGTTEEAVRRGLEKQCEPQSCIQIILFENKPIGEMNYACVGDRTYEIGIKICDASYQNRGLGKKILSVWIEKHGRSMFMKSLVFAKPAWRMTPGKISLESCNLLSIMN